MICTNKGRSILIAGNTKIRPGETIELEVVSDNAMKAFKHFAARGLMEISGIVEEPAPVVIESAPEQDVAVAVEETFPEEAPVVEAEPVEPVSKKRRGRK